MAESMKWYAIRTQNNQEKTVLEKIKLEVRRSNLDSSFGRSIIPVEKTITTRQGKKYFREKTVYPGYIFIETAAVGEINNMLKNITGAGGFVRTRSGDISPLKNDEISKILTDQEVINSKELEMVEYFNEGENVRIIDGPFNTFNGIVEKTDNEKKKLKIAVSIFGRETMVELTFNQVEKIA